MDDDVCDDDWYLPLVVLRSEELDPRSLARAKSEARTMPPPAV